MKPIAFLLTVFVCVATTGKAQTTEDSVKAVINKLFEGMKNSDGSLIKDAFADSAILQTIGNRDGKAVIRTDEVKGFVESIGKIAKGDADERIQFETIKIDGPLAIVWTPYKFYYKGQFSHCGVNSFQLVRLNGAWKIQYLIDTRRRQGCE